MKKIIDFCCKPFKENFLFFLSLFILASIADIVAWILYKEPIFAIYLGLHGYLMCYIIALIYSFIPQCKIKKIYAIFFFILAGISCIIDIICHYTLHIGFTNDMVAIIMGTNPSESMEFIETFFTTEVFMIIGLVIFVLGLLYIFKKKVNKLGRILSYLLLFALLIGTTAICVKKSKNWNGVYLCKITSLLSYSAPIDLSQYLQNPNIISIEESPQNIVLVIGESFSKSHSSLYGYDKQTNPNLEKLHQDSTLYIYKNVSSADLSTIASFQCMMSSYKKDLKNQIKWYECVTLPEIVSKTNYKSIWISNQSRNGIYDNIVSKYAELCDTTIWTGRKFSGIQKYDLDELVLDEIKNVLLDEGVDKKFIITHLMGSHYTFYSRYPKDWNIFKASDYKNFPEHQRQTLAEYDNSILYNDFVVSEICSTFKDKEAIVIYFPDHGIDVYCSDENYVGHSRTTDPTSVIAGKEIPFVIYISPLYQQNFPLMTKQIKDSISKNYNTEDILYSIMDIMGIKFSDNNDVIKYSLFQRK